MNGGGFGGAGGFSGGGFGRATGSNGTAGPIAVVNQADGPAANSNGAALAPSLPQAQANGLNGPVTDFVTGLQTAWGNITNGTPPPDPWLNPAAPQSQQAAGVASWGGGIWASKDCPPCNTNIRALQEALNQATTAAGKAAQPGHVDGKVGTSTVSGVQTLAEAAKKQGWIAESNTLIMYTTPELVAKNADVLIPRVNAIAAKFRSFTNMTAPQQFPVVGGGAPQGGGLVPYGPGPGGAVQPAPVGFLTKIKKYTPYIVGGAVVIGGAIAAYYIAKPAGASHGDD